MLKLKIATPRGIAYNKEARSITLRTTEGEITILPNHIPLVSELVPCRLKIREGQEETSINISGGVLEVRKGSEVVVLSESVVE